MNLNCYQQVMEQVENPNGVRSHHIIACTPEQAIDFISQLYRDNPAWRIIKMNYLGIYSETTEVYE